MPASIQADRAGSTITYRLNVSVLEEAMMALMDAFKLDPEGGPTMNLRPAGDRRRRRGRGDARSGGLGWGQIPPGAQVPIHWGVDGQPDGYASKELGAAAHPGR